MLFSNLLETVSAIDDSCLNCRLFSHDERCLQLVWTVFGRLRKVVALYVVDYVLPLFFSCFMCLENGGGSSLQKNHCIFQI